MVIRSGTSKSVGDDNELIIALNRCTGTGTSTSPSVQEGCDQTRAAKRQSQGNIITTQPKRQMYCEGYTMLASNKQPRKFKHTTWLACAEGCGVRCGPLTSDGIFRTPVWYGLRQ